VSEYIVTARKWRPMRFEDVVGQAHVTTTLRNALAGGRLAHAYLFSGPRGVGKTTTARLLAKVVNCLQPRGENPDNTCESCREITEGRSFDVLEIDGASNRGVDEIRNLRESVRYPPARGRYRVYIIDEVHMLTKEAFNALLKTLEEPPAHVLFIFATTEIHKVPSTILSRCQRFEFRRIPVGEISHNLRAIAGAEGIAIDDDALGLIARRADGSLRDAQSLFDQVVSLCGRSVTAAQIVEALHIVDHEMYFRVSEMVTRRDAAGAIAIVEELMSAGHDLREFLSGLLEHFRNLMIARETGKGDLIEASDHHRERYVSNAATFTMADLLRFQRFLSGTESALRWSSQPRFRLEADLVQLATMQSAPEVAEVLGRLEELTRGGGLAREPVRRAPAAARATGARVPAPASAPVLANTAAGGIREEEVVSRWGEYVAEVRSQRVSLGSLLEELRVLGVSGNQVRVACENDFQVSAVTRNRDILTELFQGVFHSPARLQPVLVAPGASAAGDASAKAAEDHPVIAALKRELGAEPLDE
jgi:DNA polymerase-3 subunit gamma/tau